MPFQYNCKIQAQPFPALPCIALYLKKKSWSTTVCTNLHLLSPSLSVYYYLLALQTLNSAIY